MTDTPEPLCWSETWYSKAWLSRYANRVKPKPMEASVHYADAHGWYVFTYQVDENGKPLPETVRMEVTPG